MEFTTPSISSRGALSGCKTSPRYTNTPPDRAAPPLPSNCGFRLQPRKNIPNLASPSPGRSFSSSGSRGRKRGAQTMVSTFGDSSLSVPKALFTPVSTLDDTSTNASILLSRPNGQSLESPISMHRAMKFMSIKSPGLSTPLSQQSTFREKEKTSPFIVFSPSLKPNPYSSAQRSLPRAGSSCSMDSSTKAPHSMVSSPRLPNAYTSPRKKTSGISSINNGELVSTPRSCSQTANLSKTPATPGSVRTLPSPRATPLPRSMRLTPRSRRGRDSSCSDTSIFLSPNENLHQSTPGKLGPVILFEGEPQSLKHKASYAPSPYSCSRSSVAPRTVIIEKTPATEARKESPEGCVRVETRSLLGPQDSSRFISDLIVSANARSAAFDCDGSLSDDESGEHFVLANPTALAQERDALNMPPPRPSRRRRTSSACESEMQSNDSTPYRDASSQSTTPNQIIVPENKEWVLNCDPISRPIVPMKSLGTRCGRKDSCRLEPIESSSSLAGLACLTAANSERPQTPPTISNELTHSLPLSPSSRSSTSTVRISRSDANNVHLTIASMAAVHQQHHSPSLMTCSS